jgi:hypothetical protein
MLRRALPHVLTLALAILAAQTVACGGASHRSRVSHRTDDEDAPRRKRRHPLARISSSDEHDRTSAYSELTERLNRGPLQVEEVEPYAEDVQRVLDHHLDEVAKLQGQGPITCGSWADQRPYVLARWETELLLDVGGAVPGQAMGASLHRALGMHDARFRYFGARALLQRGDPVAPAVFESIAAVDEVRGKLFNLLEQRGRSGDFPKNWATQELLARSRMVDWLAWNDGLGCVPRSIELAKVVTVGADDWFVFRFSVEGSKRTEPKPMAGVAGPYPHGAAPTVEGGDRTWSGFEAFDARTPDEHVKATIAHVDDGGEERPVDSQGGTTI